jgi:septal ring factor EnvC (AmiA/AmiB activator)
MAHGVADKLIRELERQQREIERLRREHERADLDRNRYRQQRDQLRKKIDRLEDELATAQAVNRALILAPSCGAVFTLVGSLGLAPLI